MRERNWSLAILRASLFSAIGVTAIACGDDGANTTDGSGGTAGAGATGATAGAGNAGNDGGAGNAGGNGNAGNDGGAGNAGNAGGAGGAGNAGGAGGAGGAPPEVCPGGVPVQDIDGTDSGFVQCPDGTIHRAAQEMCSPQNDATACQGTEDILNCEADTDCTAQPNGKCVSFAGGFALPSCGCVYSCESDQDCDSGEVCVCAGVTAANPDYSMCVQADCQTGADCTSGECGLSAFHDGCFWDTRLACREEGDACRLDSECSGASCSLYGSFEWQCNFPGCAIGRPLLVDGSARTAPIATRGDWKKQLALDVDRLPAQTRQVLAAYWEDVARLEHASVASFARFSLSLLALGAPPESLLASQQAAIDEVEHATLAFAIASAFAGRDLGPGPLDVTDVPVLSDRVAIVASLIEEACIGETIGAAEARAAAQGVRDPALSAELTKVAEDEERHARLAWSVLTHVLEGASMSERAAAVSTLRKAVLDFPTETGDRAGHPAYGVPSSASLRALRQQTLSEVIVPSIDALANKLGVGIA